VVSCSSTKRLNYESTKKTAFKVSHESGFYAEPFNLTIDHSSQSKIYYTTDGSYPDTTSQLYNSPINLSAYIGIPGNLSSIPTTPLNGMWQLQYFKWIPPKIEVTKRAATIRIREFQNGVPTSGFDAFTFVYFIGKDDAQKHQFPVVSIVTDKKHLFDYEKGIYVPGIHYDSASWKGPTDPFWPPGNYQMKGKLWERPAAVHYFDEDDELGFSLDAGIRIQGAVIGGFPIKSLRIVMKKKFGDSILNYPVFKDSKLSTYKRLLLRTSGNDFLGTYFKDALLQDVLSPLDLELQSSTPSVVYINGEYWGIHNIREKLDKHFIKTHFNLKEDQFDIVEVCETLNHGDIQEYKNLIDYIKNNDISSDDVYGKVSEQIDIKNYIDYNLAELYFGNSDWPGNNVKLWKEKGIGNKWRWLVFDLDLSFGYSQMNFFHSPDHNSLKDATAIDSKEWFNYDCSTFLFRTLLKNESFKKQFVSRYLELSASNFSADYIISKINAYENLYASEMEAHINRWNYPKSMNSWREEIDKMREYARNRPKYFKAHIELTLNVNIDALSK